MPKKQYLGVLHDTKMKVKAKFNLEQAMKAHKESRNIALLFL
jgi:hypothetical protein